MNCPKCKVELSITDDNAYGKVYVCEICGIIVIELNIHARATPAHMSGVDDISRVSKKISVLESVEPSASRARK